RGRRSGAPLEGARAPHAGQHRAPPPGAGRLQLHTARRCARDRAVDRLGAPPDPQGRGPRARARRRGAGPLSDRRPSRDALEGAGGIGVSMSDAAPTKSLLGRTSEVRTLLGYGLMLLAAVAFYFLVRARGEALIAPDAPERAAPAAAHSSAFAHVLLAVA